MYPLVQAIQRCIWKWSARVQEATTSCILAATTEFQTVPLSWVITLQCVQGYYYSAGPLQGTHSRCPFLSDWPGASYVLFCEMGIRMQPLFQWMGMVWSITLQKWKWNSVKFIKMKKRIIHLTQFIHCECEWCRVDRADLHLLTWWSLAGENEEECGKSLWLGWWPIWKFVNSTLQQTTQCWLLSILRLLHFEAYTS